MKSLSKRLLLSGCALGLLLLAGCLGIGGKAHDLRGPGWQVGQQVRAIWLLNFESPATPNSPAQRFGINLSSQFKVLAVDAQQRLSRYAEQIISDLRRLEINVAGTAHKFSQRSLLEGQTLWYERKNGYWDKVLAGKDPTYEQYQTLLNLEAWLDDSSLYPADPARVGHQWTLSGAELKPLLAGHITPSAGEATFTLEQVVEFRGEICALIKVNLKLTGKLGDEQENQGLQLAMTLQGSYYRALQTGINLEGELNGDLTLTGKAPPDLPVAAQGPLTLKFANTLL